MQIPLSDAQNVALLEDSVENIKTQWLTIYRFLNQKNMHTEAKADQPLLTQILFELALLGRLLYRNKNQHRAGKYFQHLQHVKRRSRFCIESMLIMENEKALVNILASTFNQLGVDQNTLNLPSVENMEKFMKALDFVIESVVEVKELTAKAYVTTQTHLMAPGYFLPFATVLMAWCARWYRLLTNVEEILENGKKETRKFLGGIYQWRIPQCQEWLNQMAFEHVDNDSTLESGVIHAPETQLKSKDILEIMASSVTVESTADKGPTTWQETSAPDLPTHSSRESLEKPKKKRKKQKSSSDSIIDDLFAGIE